MCVPTSWTITGAVYGCQAPSAPTAYSMVLTPDPVSDAVTVIVAIPRYAPWASFSPETVAEVSGAVLSSVGGAATAKSTDFSAAVLPALSVARYRMLCVPTSFTTTGVVYGCQAPSAPTAYSTVPTPELSSVAETVTVA